MATGDNFSDPPTRTSDAVLAINLKTGEWFWSTQPVAGDVFNDGCLLPTPGNCPAKHGPDHDFGQSPILLDLHNGKRVLLIAQNSGVAYALDPDDKGRLLWQTRVGNGGALGGS